MMQVKPELEIEKQLINQLVTGESHKEIVFIQ